MPPLFVLNEPGLVDLLFSIVDVSAATNILCAFELWSFEYEFRHEDDAIDRNISLFDYLRRFCWFAVYISTRQRGECGLLGARGAQ